MTSLTGSNVIVVGDEIVYVPANEEGAEIVAVSTLSVIIFLADNVLVPESHVKSLSPAKAPASLY